MNTLKKLYGITVAMVTPFDGDGHVDLGAVGMLSRMLVDKGVNCLYPCGTTGEMLRMTVSERKAVAETVVKAAEGKATVYIHCGAMTEEDTIELAMHARDIGADGVGIVTPQFFGANDRELVGYYKRVAGNVPDFPIYLYNIPQCAGNDLTPTTVDRITDACPNVIGIKYSFADINRTIDYVHAKKPGFSVLHGCDRALTGMLALGCDGTVSGIAGVFPEPFVAVYEAYTQGDMERAGKLQDVCIRFCDALKRGTNMSYFKEGLKMRGIPAGYMRRPQLDLEPEETKRLGQELEMLCAKAGIEMKL